MHLNTFSRALACSLYVASARVHELKENHYAQEHTETHRHGIHTHNAHISVGCARICNIYMRLHAALCIVSI